MSVKPYKCDEKEDLPEVTDLEDSLLLLGIPPTEPQRRPFTRGQEDLTGKTKRRVVVEIPMPQIN